MTTTVLTRPVGGRDDGAKSARVRNIAACRDALGRGDLEAVGRLATLLVTPNSGDDEGHFLLGMAVSGTGRVVAGIEHVQRAIALNPAGEYRAQLARLLTLVRRDGEAAATLRDAERALPADALGRDTMGCVYARLGDHEAALGHFEAAVRLEPRNLDFRYNHATTLNFLGRTAEAEAAIEALLALAPHEARAHHLLAGLRKQTAQSNHVARLQLTHAQARSGRDRLLLGYALAKELEDVGQPDEALDALCVANAEHRRNLPYDFARDAAVFDAIEASWSGKAPLLEPASDSRRDGPIFVFGMPRTGTTLVDRILSSHPEVESAGELQAMPLAVKRAAGTRSRTVLDAETIQAVRHADMAAIGQSYLQNAGHHRRGLKPRFVDKFPGNFHYAGVIAQALPSASIVCLRRHPMDTVLSNFRNLFAVSSRYYDYSYDLREIAAYYLRFDRLMAMWRQVLPGRVLEVRYEDLVADQAGATRRMLEHCGLDWSDACMAFHDNAAPVSTPSAAQVRRPIYTDSVARWKRHASVLEPVRRYFADAGVSLD